MRNCQYQACQEPPEAAATCAVERRIGDPGPAGDEKKKSAEAIQRGQGQEGEIVVA